MVQLVSAPSSKSAQQMRLDGRERAVRKLSLSHTMELQFSPEAKGETLKDVVGKSHVQICF